jgi:hypothetical protein
MQYWADKDALGGVYVWIRIEHSPSQQDDGAQA